VNFYKHYLGDHQRDTMRLSLVEDGAYRRLMDEYYATETPLPLDREECYRATRAITRDEKNAVDKILTRYFQKKDDGYHHGRIDEEVEKARHQAATNRRIAEEREAQRNRNEPLDESLNENGTYIQPIQNHCHNQIPEPRTINQKKRDRFTPPVLQEVEQYCLERKNGIDAQKFLDYYTANGWIQGKGKPVRDWKAAVRVWERRDKEFKQQPANKGNGSIPNPRQTVELEHFARQLGVIARPGESYIDLHRRCIEAVRTS